VGGGDIDSKILIIVPAFNEEDNISQVMASLKKKVAYADVMVINDGSSDNTASIVCNISAKSLISLPVNLGIGGAVQTGFIYAQRYNYDIAVQFDGDGQHLASEIDKLLSPIIKHETDVVIGSRFTRKGLDTYRSTPLRLLGIKMFKFINSLLIGQRITDNTSGFRAYNRRAIEFLAQNYPMDYPEPEAVILLGKNHFRLKEVYTRMAPRDGGVSSISGFDSVYYMVKVFLAVFMNALRSPIL